MKILKFLSEGSISYNKEKKKYFFLISLINTEKLIFKFVGPVKYKFCPPLLRAPGKEIFFEFL